MVAGALPYRDFAVEYPPPAIAFLAVPAFAARALTHLSANSYAVFFGLEALMLDALLCTVLARFAGRQAVLWYLLLSLIGGSVLQTFDLLPSALTATAVLLRQRGKDRYAWLALAAAVATKGWPLLLVPLFLALDIGNLRRLAINVGLAALLFVSLIVPSLMGGLTRAEEALAFHAQRAPEVETVYANLAMAVHDAFGVPARVYTGGLAAVPLAHSSDVASMLPGWALLPHLILAMLLVFGYLRTLPRLRRDQASLPGATALLVGLFILGFSVLETQYFLWLAPLTALVLARAAPLASLRRTSSGVQVRIAASLLLFALLSHLLRIEWSGLLEMQPSAVAIAIIRNACLVLALVFLWQYIPSAMQDHEHEHHRQIA
jgi:hypothetical protein